MSEPTLRAEVCLAMPEGDDLWIVPAYSNADRFELSMSDLEAILKVVDAFEVKNAVIKRIKTPDSDRLPADMSAASKNGSPPSADPVGAASKKSSVGERSLSLFDSPKTK